MKNTILAIALTLTGVVTYAQVGVGTQEPQTTLHVVGKNATSIAVGGTNTPGALDTTDGITVPVVTTNMTAAPPAGTKISQLVYSTHASSTGYYYWNGTTWTALVAATPAFNVTALQTGNYTALATDNLIQGNITSPSTLTLPTTGLTAGKIFYISNKGTADWTLSPIPANNGLAIISAGFGATLIWTGTEWVNVSGY